MSNLNINLYLFIYLNNINTSTPSLPFLACLYFQCAYLITTCHHSNTKIVHTNFTLAFETTEDHFCIIKYSLILITSLIVLA